MRHQKKRHKLGRTRAHRKATLASLSTALIEHKRITTTLPKAKALRTFVEPLITRAKDDTGHNRRQVFRHLNDKTAVNELFGDVAEQVGDRPGGYTRVIKLGRRHGDGADMAMIELVDYNDVQPEGGGGGGRRRTRRGGGKGRRRRGKGQGQKATEPSTQPEAKTAAATETVEPVDADADVEKAKDVVEAPVSEEQATPVPERTEPDAEAEEHADEAQEIIEAQKAEAAEAEAEPAEDDEEDEEKKEE